METHKSDKERRYIMRGAILGGVRARRSRNDDALNPGAPQDTIQTGPLNFIQNTLFCDEKGVNKT